MGLYAINISNSTSQKADWQHIDQEPPRATRLTSKIDPLGRFDCSKCIRTNQMPIPTHCHAYQKSPMGWHCIGPHLRFVSIAPWFQLASDGLILSPHEYSVVVPARQAYSHWLPWAIHKPSLQEVLPASCSFKR